LYFRKAAAVIVVFDITREQTFEDAKRWVKDLKNQAPEVRWEIFFFANWVIGCICSNCRK